MCESHDHLVSGAVVSTADAFHAFAHETPAHAEAWLEASHRLEHASALDERTLRLAHLAVLAALGLDDAIPLQVELACDAGARREEVASAVLVGLSAAGSRVVRSLPTALAAFDRANGTAADWVTSLDPAGLA